MTLQPGTNTWVEVTTNTRGLVQIEPARRLFNTHMCLAGHGIAQVERNKPFRILVANFGKVARKLLPGQGIAQANSHPTRIYESDITHAELLGIIEEDSAQMYRKRDIDAKDTAVINKYLQDVRNSHMGEDEKPITADDIYLSDVDANITRLTARCFASTKKCGPGSSDTSQQHPIESTS